MPSTDIVTSPHNMHHSKTSSVMCGHTNCNLTEHNTSQSMSKPSENGFQFKTFWFSINLPPAEYVDEIIPWNEQELYDANDCW